MIVAIPPVLESGVILFFNSTQIAKWAFLAFIPGTRWLSQAHQALPYDQTNDQPVVDSSNWLSLPRYERHHLSLRQSNSLFIQDDSIIFKSQLMPKEL